MRAIATLIKPAAGRVSLDGRTARSELRSRIAFLPQDGIPRSRFTIADFLAYIAWLRKVPTERVAAEVARVIELTRLTDRAQSAIGSLSGGMRQRVGIAASLLASPKVAVLDEPSAGLDVQQRAALTAVLTEAALEATVVVSTHIVEDVLLTADTLTIMHEGRFRYSGTFDDFCPSRDLAEFNHRYHAVVNQ